MSKRAKRVAFDWVKEHREQVTAMHDQIWHWAEVGLQEMRTGKLLADTLERHGFAVEHGVAGMPSAFVASFGEGTPVIGVMGELDALPGLSQKAIPWREVLQEGAAGHGCGHQGYATAALAAALAVKRGMEVAGLPGTVKCFGCPAEETLVGKVFMVRDGVFAGVDACLGYHPGQSNSVSLGSGNALNSAKFEFFGVPAHAGGSPERGISALDAVELMNIAANYLREHMVQEARIHYVIEEGGHEPNVVPPYARVWYYLRAPERDLVEQYYQRLLRIAEGADLMTGTTHKVRFLTGVYNGIPNRVLAELIVANMRESGAPSYAKEELEFAKELAKSIPREQKVASLRSSHLPDALELVDIDLNTRIYDPYGEGRKGGGSTDVADVSWNLPAQEFSTTMFIVGSPGHSWQNVASGGTSIAHKATIFAAQTMAGTVLDLLTSPEALQKAKDEWRERTRGQVYRSPLPADLKPPLDQLPAGLSARG